MLVTCYPYPDCSDESVLSSMSQKLAQLSACQEGEAQVS